MPLSFLSGFLGDARESDQGKAMDLLNAWIEGREELSAPRLWQYEVGNFLGRNLPKEAGGKMDLLLNVDIRSVDFTGSMVQLCFSWMRQNRVTFYDACYLAAAFEIQATLITADETFVKKMGKMNRICLLKDLVF